VAELVAKQGVILAAAARLLKPGGRLVYATCSLLRAENEEVGDAFGAAHPGFEKLDVAQVLRDQGVSSADTLVTGGSLRMWPHLHSTDGFFAMIWRKAQG
jgi:16S rRNA (cytosine967-C5)-methyltransferase